MGVMQNPVTRFRVGKHQTQGQLARDIGMHEQAVFLCEQGVYVRVLPRIEHYMVRTGVDPKDIAREYKLFQVDRRTGLGDREGFLDWTVTSLGPPVGSPFEGFRNVLGLSRMRLCKSLCVHPAAELALEAGHRGELGSQIRDALLQAGMPGAVVAELDSRVKEYWESNHA